MSHFFFVSLVLLFSLEMNFAIETTWEESHHHRVQTSSLLPSSSCTSSTKGPKRKSSTLDVVHKHGPCSQLNKNGKANYVQTHSDILKHDKERINYIHSKLLSGNSNNNKVETKLDSSSSVNLPAKSGSLIGSGNYYVVVGLGTPKRDLSLCFDTGSDLTWTQCQPCARSCYSQEDAIFDPSESTTYNNITCTSPDCTQLSLAGIRYGCYRATKACIYQTQYLDQSFSSGYFSRERLTVTPTDTIDSFLFGCGQDNEGLFNGAAGLLGLGRHPISIVQQTSQKYHKIFSYCLPSTSSGVGHLTFGATDNKYVKYTPLSTVSRSNSFYGLNMEGIIVGGTKLPISSSIFTSSGVVIDSGTVITRLPPTAYASLRDSFRKYMANYPPASPDPPLFDTCYDLSGTQTLILPNISFVFGGGVTVELPTSGILFGSSSKQLCLAFAANSKDSDITIFGNTQQKTLEVVYDIGGGKIGFGSNGCK